MVLRSDPDPDEWQRKGDALSDKRAREEFALTQDQIVAGIRAGHLHYREASMHDNPWLRLLRREVEAWVKQANGGNYLQSQKAKTELATINRELKRLKAQVVVLERRRSALMSEAKK